jgi:hypothetical protein
MSKMKVFDHLCQTVHSISFLFCIQLLVLIILKPEYNDLVEKLPSYYNGSLWARTKVITALNVKQRIQGQYRIVEDYLFIRVVKPYPGLYFIGIAGTWIVSDYFRSYWFYALLLLCWYGMMDERLPKFLFSLIRNQYLIIVFMVVSSKILQLPISNRLEMLLLSCLCSVAIGLFIFYPIGLISKRCDWICILSALSSISLVYYACYVPNIKWWNYNIASSEIVLLLLLLQIIYLYPYGLLGSTSVLLLRACGII